MFNEEVFKFDIDNIKNDLAIEGMEITNADVDMYRRFANDELNMPQLIEIIKIKVYKIKITQKTANKQKAVFNCKKCRKEKL